jgi:hypothetical protein
MLTPKASVTLGLVLSVSAWLVAAVGFVYAFSQSDVSEPPGTMSPQRFAMAQSTFSALSLSVVGCFLGAEGLVKRWYPFRARVAIIVGAPIVVLVVAAIAWHELLA